ncbi:MAG: nicotinate-nucleotide adenylyltransferase, partial [Mollicutes bacterium PWAP]|nr:nicotinate-nucleotide adenylyltransferase [Mollicutes bacterium PWAP]
MKIGLFGGSFNPITKKDINLAKEAIDHLNLDKFIFIPFYKRNDRKNFKPGNDKHRMKMINLAISNEEKMELSDFEIKRKGVSYSIDTVKFFSKHPNELFFIIGGDKLTNFDKFKNVEQLSKLSNLSIFEHLNHLKKIFL